MCVKNSPLININILVESKNDRSIHKKTEPSKIQK